MKKILFATFIIILTLFAVVACTNDEPKSTPKPLCDFEVDFFIEGVDASEELGYLLDGVSLKGYAGTQADISESILFNIPQGLIIEEEKSVLSGTVTADDTLKLEVHYSLDREKLNYNFNAENKFVKYVVSALGVSKNDGIVADDTSSSGYALSATRENGVGGIKVDFDGIKPSDYDRIFVRVRATGSQTYSILANGEIELLGIDRGAYAVYDIKPSLDENEIKVLNSLEFYSSVEESGSVMIDSIVFVNDETVWAADPSFLMKRDDGSIYLSDFNSQGIMRFVETVGVDSSGNEVGVMTKASFDFAPNDKAHYNVVHRGIKVIASGASGVKYNFPTDFDLAQANEVVIRFTCDAWHGGFLPSFFLFTDGENTSNIINYCKIYFQNGQSPYGNYTTTETGNLFGQNYRRCTLVLDVDAFIAATGMSRIDGVIFGVDRASSFDTHYIDDMYFTVDSEEKAIPNTEFYTYNVENSGYYLEDTAYGLKITGTSSTFAIHTLESSISGADIKTVTVKYAESGSAQAIIKFISGDKDIYFNLTKAKLGDAGVISKETDENGVTVIKLNFAELPSDSWTASERETLELTAIGIGSNNIIASPIFDCVIYND